MPRKIGDIPANELVTVGADLFSRNYNDLTNKPTLGTAAALNTPIPMSQISEPVKQTVDAVTALNDSAAFHETAEFATASALSSHISQTAVHGRYFSSLVTNISAGSIERQITGLTLPANSLHAGSTFRFRAHGNFTMTLVQPSLSTCNIRIGPVSLLGTIAAGVTVNNGKSKVSAPFMVEGEVTVRSIGLLGTIGGWLAMWGAAAAPFTDDITTLSVYGLVNTTVQNVLEATYVTSKTGWTT